VRRFGLKLAAANVEFPRAFEDREMIVPRRNKPFRIAVRSGAARSNVWRISTRKSEVYLTVGETKAEKFSFHSSGICRHAFTAEFGAPAGMNDRVMTRWRRAPIPPPNVEKAATVLEVAFPTDFLSTAFPEVHQEVHWLPAAPEGCSTHLAFVFSADPAQTVQPLVARGQGELLAAFELENHNWFYVVCFQSAFKGQEIRLPSAGTRRFDLVIARRDAANTGRPVRVLVMSTPTDGDKMVAWEYGAIRADPDADIAVDGTISADKIYHATWKNS
jgi:hypothetical protein